MDNKSDADDTEKNSEEPSVNIIFFSSLLDHCSIDFSIARFISLFVITTDCLDLIID